MAPTKASPAADSRPEPASGGSWAAMAPAAPIDSFAASCAPGGSPPTESLRSSAYFKSKEEIVQAIGSETLGGFAQAIESGPEGEPLGPAEVVDRFFDAVETIERRRERLRLAVQAWGEVLHNPKLSDFVLELVDGLRARISAELRDAQRRGALDPDLDPDAAARVLFAVVQGFAVQSTWYEDLDTAAFRAAAHRLLSQATLASRLSG
jgi:AcrR family transcriptional regulator